MPESGAISRTRDAMDAWLHKGLPADFDQLRRDLKHILGCLPPCDCHDITLPAGIALHVEHRGDFSGAVDRLTLSCGECELRWAWEPRWEPEKIEHFAAEHRRLDHA